MQLVAYGMQDVYLTGNSQITFFKNLYRRHTNFSVEAVEQTFQANTTAFGSNLVAVVSRNGDLLHRLWLEVSLRAPPDNEADGTATYVNNLGHALVKSAQVDIGGQKIDQIYGRFNHLWHKLSCSAESEFGYDVMTGNGGAVPEGKKHTFAGDRKLYVPIQFFFSKGNAGAALPLIALQYHEVRISIDIAGKEEILRTFDANGVTKYNPATASANDIPGFAAPPRLFSDFFYLDTEERKRFSQMSHEYLIEQLQFTGREVTPKITAGASVPLSVSLTFNHPTKAIYWTSEIEEDNLAGRDPFYNGLRRAAPEVLGLKASGVHAAIYDNCPVEAVSLNLNGQERFAERDGEYFWLCQPYQHHARIPYDHWLGMYSFCLQPEEHQPSGTLNFSRIDNAILRLAFKKSPAGDAADYSRTVHVYAINYNVLRILSGMGGLAFSN